MQRATDVGRLKQGQAAKPGMSQHVNMGHGT